MTKRNIFKDPSPYGTYEGPRGNPDQWRGAFEEAASKDGALAIIKQESPWSILGIGADSTFAQVKAAYRALIHRWHPDHKDGDGEKCVRIIAAYTIIAEGFGE